MKRRITVLGINCSFFDGGNVAQVLSTALAAAKESGALTKVIHLGDIPHHDGRREEETHSLKERVARLPQEGDLQKVVKEILRADGVIFATPVHWFNMSSRLLALLSWLATTTDAPDYALEGKVAAVMAVCEEDGAQSANEKMVSALIHLGFIIPPFCTYFFNKSSAHKSEGGWQLEDQPRVGHVCVCRKVSCH